MEQLHVIQNEHISPYNINILVTNNRILYQEELHDKKMHEQKSRENILLINVDGL